MPRRQFHSGSPQPLPLMIVWICLIIVWLEPSEIVLESWSDTDVPWMAEPSLVSVFCTLTSYGLHELFLFHSEMNLEAFNICVLLFWKKFNSTRQFSHLSKWLTTDHWVLRIASHVGHVICPTPTEVMLEFVKEQSISQSILCSFNLIFAIIPFTIHSLIYNNLWDTFSVAGTVFDTSCMWMITQPCITALSLTPISERLWHKIDYQDVDILLFV